jgi:hypothetical protein
VTLSEAERQYREFMSRLDVAYAFGHGCAMNGGSASERALRADADRLLTQLTVARAASGRPLNARGHGVEVAISRNQLAEERA